MVSANDPDPNPHHDHSPEYFPLHHHYRPRKGEAIEVCTDEEGFVGAWYPATMESCSKKRKKKALVRYDTLVSDEDGRTPLIESVDPAFIRPVPPPPPDDGGGVKFEVNDVVDARYKEGWWCGVVRKVHEGKRYRVLFDNPPDAFDFEVEDLRFHFDWVFGKWVRPEKQRPSEGVFSLGTEVEVNLDTGKVGDAWFPAIVVKQNEDQTFLVKCESSNSCGDDEEAMFDMLVVDSLHMRLSPCKSRWDYNLMELVNANIDGRWQKGIITKVLAGGRYTVLFKEQNEYREFTWWTLRPDFQWDDGDWKPDPKAESKELLVALSNQQEVDSQYTAADNLEIAVAPVSSPHSSNDPKEKTPSSSIIRIMVDGSAVRAKKYASDVLASIQKKRLKLDIPNTQLLLHKNIKEVDTRDTCLSATKQKKTSSGPPPSSNDPKEKTPSSSTTRILVNDSAVRAKKSASDVLTSRKQKKLKVDIPNTQLLLHKNIKAVDTREASLSLTKEKENSSGPDKEILPDQMTSEIKRKRVTKPRSSLCGDQLSAENANIHDIYCQKVAIVASNDSPTKSLVGSSLVSVTGNKEAGGIPEEVGPPVNLGLGAVGQPREYDKLKPLGDQKKGSENPGELSSENNQQESQERKRGSPQKLGLVNSSTEAGIELSGTDDGSEMVVTMVADETGGQLQPGKDSTVPPNGLVENNAHVPEIESLRKEAADTVITPTKRVAEDDQRLSIWFGGQCSSTDVHEGSNGLRDKKWNQEQVDPATNPDVLPFVKRSPAWPSIESMDVFRIMPQKPHFLPLMESQEDQREGAAIGWMVTFSNLFEKISTLCIHDPRALFETTLISLSDLEKHGFDVTVLRDRVNKLLSIREPVSKWLNTIENGERELQQHVEERTNLDATIKEIEKKISALQKTLAEAKAKDVAKEARAAIVHLLVDEMKVRINDAQNEFERVAASSWN